jgi:iron(III) transport system substrate-binding protein
MIRVIAALFVGLVASSSVMAADTLVVYSAGPKPLSKGLAQAFEKKIGIKVELFQSTAGKIMARYEAEKANPQVDVLISASWGHAITLDKAGELMPYTSTNASKVPASLKSTSYVAQGAAALAIAYNPKSGVPAPTSWSDLTKPVYKGQITMPDPAKSGSALTLVQGLVTQNSDQAWDMFAKLKSNDMIVPGANKAALNPVLQGAKGVVFGAVDYIAIGAKAKGESLEVVYPASGTVLAPRPMMIVKTTQHAQAAKAFIDFVLSERGQQMVAAKYILPARTDIKAKRPGWNELNIINFDAVKAAEEAPAIKSRFKQIMK